MVHKTLLQLSLGLASAAAQCTFNVPDKRTTFDLSALSELTSAQPAVVRDRIQTSQQDYIYTFGICNNVTAPPSCTDATTGNNQVKYDKAPAWQTSATDPKHCVYLAAPDKPQGATQWALLDENDPAAGVNLTYTGGQSCHSGGASRRTFSILLQCAANTVEKIEQQVIDESAHCAYDITIKSEYACPTQCGFGASRKLCGGHGLCGYDSDAAESRCYCNKGYHGADCSQSDDAEEAPAAAYSTSIMVLLSFVALGMLTMILGAIWFIKYRAKKLDAIGDLYSRLHDDGSDSSFNSFQLDAVQVVPMNAMGTENKPLQGGNTCAPEL